MKRNRCLSNALVHIFFLVTVLLTACSSADEKNHNPSSPTGLLIELLQKPLVVENLKNPAFSWIVNDTDRNEVQMAYRIIVAKNDSFLTTKSKLKKKNDIVDLVWDSGKVESSKSSGVDYLGPELDKGTLYYWSVQTWDKDDKASPFAEVQYYGTALENTWTASPIWQDSRPLKKWVFFRKSFQVDDKPIKSAIIYATGNSPEDSRQYVYRMNLNGKFVGLGPVRGFNDNNYYNAFEVTSLLTQGAENVIGTTAFTYSSTKSFMAELRIVYQDGSSKTVKTDDTWKVLDGTKVFPDAGNVHSMIASTWVGFKYPNENINAADYPFGFDSKGYDDSAWEKPAIVAPIEKLMGYPAANLTEVDVAPVKVTTLSDGSFVLDFGVTIVGGIKLSIDTGDTPSGPIDIKMGEELNSDGTAKWQQTASVNYEDKWSLKQGQQTIQHFGYRVFRYAQVSGLPSFVNASNIGEYLNAFALRYPFDEASSEFSSSNDMLNTIWNFSKKSIEVLNQDLFVDSSNRERAPYEADSYIQQLSNYQLSQDYSLARFSTDWLTYRPTWPTEWKIYSIMASWQDYLYTGDDHLIRKNYDILKEKIPTKLVDGWNASTGVITAEYAYGMNGDNSDIVDWPSNYRDGYEYTKTHNVMNAFYYKANLDLAQIASALGNTADATGYEAKADASKLGIQNTFFDVSKKVFKDNDGGKLNYSSHSNSFVPAFGAASTDQAKAAADYLASRGELKGNVYSAPEALATMFRNGQEEEAINQITGLNTDGTMRDSTHNWRHMIEKGAGSTMEDWDGSGSCSHAWGTAPSIVVPQEIFGIKPIMPAFEEFEIKPIKSGLDSAFITVPTVRGSITVSFNKSSSEYSLSIQVPVNTKATVYIPATGKESVTEGDQLAYKTDGVTYLGMEDNYTKYLVGSGCYQFITK